MNDTPMHESIESTPSADLSSQEMPPAETSSKQSLLFRSLLYTPLLILSSGMISLAMFPELAKYAEPFLGDKASHCSSRVEMTGSCCSHGASQCCLASSAENASSDEVCNGSCPLSHGTLAGEATTSDSHLDESAFFVEPQETTEQPVQKTESTDNKQETVATAE